MVSFPETEHSKKSLLSFGIKRQEAEIVPRAQCVLELCRGRFPAEALIMKKSSNCQKWSTKQESSGKETLKPLFFYPWIVSWNLARSPSLFRESSNDL